MRLLVLGGTGMAGHTISMYFHESGYDVTAFSRRNFPYGNNIIGDVTDIEFLKKIIVSGEYDVVINAIGILNLQAETNKANAVFVNSYLPHFLSDLTRDMKTKIIHMSTDCVFSGKSGSYDENSNRDGETFYDRSKALGELDNKKDLTFRNSIIGPDLNVDGIGLFNWFMKQNSDIQGYTKAIWTGVTTLTLAKAIEQAIKEDLSGLYHLVNNTSISKYELLKLFSKHFRNSSIGIGKNSAYEVDKSLVNNRTDFSFVVPEYEEMVVDMKHWIESHKDLYPHYFL